jgi:endothelin-converting enzyme
VNGRLTLGENIADAGGLTASFHAWKKHDDAKPDPHLPGLEKFTKEQLFFISYGNWWCGKTTKEAAEQAIYNDPHAPKSARIIVSIPNECIHSDPVTDYCYRKRWPTLGSLRMRSVAQRRSQLASSGNFETGHYVLYIVFSVGNITLVLSKLHASRMEEVRRDPCAESGIGR